MKRLPLLALLTAIAAAIFVACSSSDDNSAIKSGGEQLKVVTTVAPITSIAENIGGTKIKLTGVIPEGTNSHTYEPSPSIASTLSEADLIVVNGLQLEESTLELANANRKADSVILKVGDETIAPGQYKYDSSSPQSGGKPNPHLWPDPTLTKNYATLIHEQLVKLDPDNETYYDANYSALTKRLETLDQQIRIVTQTVPAENRKLLTYHDSWVYWADRYGFTVIGAIQPSDFSEPSASEVAGLIDQIKREKVPAIFGSEVFPSDVLSTIASESGAKYVDDLRDDDLPGKPGDPEHSYLGLMVQNMRIMIPALGGDAAPMDRVETTLVFTDGPSTADYPQ